MLVGRDTILWMCMGLVISAASLASAQPPPVPRLTERSLDRASYVELVSQWKSFIEEHGETADALVNLGMAYDYSEEQEAATRAGERAVELEPDNPRALEFLGKMVGTYVGDRDRAIELLQRCRKVAPDHGYGLTTLASMHLGRGELEAADEIFEVIFQQGVIPRPLQDYAYNMLVGVPQGAVLITAGDNDTFGPLALQAGMDFRTDVVIMNRSLLNLPDYARAVLNRHPFIDLADDAFDHEPVLVDGVRKLLSDVLIQRLVEQGSAAVYFSASANTGQMFFQPETHIEGLNLRVSGDGLKPEAAARLFLDRYRLDSATDWSYPWSLAPSVAHLLRNYVAAMIRTLDADEITLATRAGLVAHASSIAAFHELTAMTDHLRKLRDR